MSDQKSATPDIDTQIESLLVNYGRILQRVSPEHSLTKRTYRETAKAIKTLLIQSNAKAICAELLDSLNNDNLDDAAYPDIERRYDRNYAKLKEEL